MIRTSVVAYLLFTAAAGPHVCCATERVASILIPVRVTRSEEHRCCPQETTDPAPSPEMPCVPPPCEEGRTAPSLFLAETGVRTTEPGPAAMIAFFMPVDSPLASLGATQIHRASGQLGFAFLYGTDLLHFCQRLTC